MTWNAAGTFSRNRLPPWGSTTVTPVRAGPRGGSPDPSSMIVTWPTWTPGTSVIALCGPGSSVPSTIPSSRGRGLRPRLPLVATGPAGPGAELMRDLAHPGEPEAGILPGVLDHLLEQLDPVPPADDLRVHGEVEHAAGHPLDHEVDVAGPDLEDLRGAGERIGAEARRRDELELWEVVPAPAHRDLHDLARLPEQEPSVRPGNVPDAGVVAVVVVGGQARVVPEAEFGQQPDAVVGQVPSR